MSGKREGEGQKSLNFVALLFGCFQGSLCASQNHKTFLSIKFIRKIHYLSVFCKKSLNFKVSRTRLGRKVTKMRRGVHRLTSFSAFSHNLVNLSASTLYERYLASFTTNFATFTFPQKIFQVNKFLCFQFMAEFHPRYLIFK